MHTHTYTIYKVGFWVLVGITFCGIILGLGVLHTYDKSVQDIVSKIMYTTNTPNAPTHYAWLPDHYYDKIDLPFPYSYQRIESIEEFEAWANKPGGVLFEYKNRPTTSDVPAHVEVEVIEVFEKPGYTLTKFNMPSFFDPEVITFYELLPDTKDFEEENYNAVLVIPGSGQGARDVLGEDSSWSWAYYHDSIGRTLTHAGYAIYVIELRGYGERAIDVGTACVKKGSSHTTCSSFAVENKMARLGISMSDIRTDEITQVLAHIESKPYIRDVAVAGLSLGAGLAANQAIINSDVVDAVIMASGIGSVVYSPLNMESGGTQDMTDCCDSIDKIATIAPLPAYVSYGSMETTMFRWESESNHTGNFLAGVYQLHNATENLRYVVHKGGHEYHVESVLDFLYTHLDKSYPLDYHP